MNRKQESIQGRATPKPRIETKSSESLLKDIPTHLLIKELQRRGIEVQTRPLFQTVRVDY